MIRTLAVACTLAAGCTDGTGVVFEVDGYNDVAAVTRGSVLALWALPATPERMYKFGDGISVDRQFTIGWETEPPPGALDANGLGVAILVLVPPLTTVPDGELDPRVISARGVSADAAIVYKTGATASPPWSASFGPRFSCAGCVRGGGDGGLDSFELIPCANVIIEGPGSQTCAWF